jgi:hypothetical protein
MTVPAKPVSTGFFFKSLTFIGISARIDILFPLWISRVVR